MKEQELDKAGEIPDTQPDDQDGWIMVEGGGREGVA